MKLLDFATFIFYRYYSKGKTQSIAYEKSIVAIMILVYLNVLTLTIFLEIDLFPKNYDLFGIGKKYLLSFAFVIFFFFGFTLMLPKKRIENLHYSKEALKSGGFIMVFYILASFTLFYFAVKQNM